MKFCKLQIFSGMKLNGLKNFRRELPFYKAFSGSVLAYLFLKSAKKHILILKNLTLSAFQG